MRILKIKHNNILRTLFKLLTMHSILFISQLIRIILTYLIKLVVFFSNGKKYLQAIIRFHLILLKKNKISFFVFNILGILSKVMLIIGFIYAAKMATLIYQNKISPFLNSEQLGQMQGVISFQVAILLISFIAVKVSMKAESLATTASSKGRNPAKLVSKKVKSLVIFFPRGRLDERL